MTPQQTNACRQQLLALHAALIEQINVQRGGVVSRAQAAADHFERREDSGAQVATERELEFAIGEHEVDELAALDAALARIEAGTYGECTDCGVNIPVPRLQASPAVMRCIPCQEKVEHVGSA